MTSVLMEVCTKYRRSTKESQAGPGGGKQWGNIWVGAQDLHTWKGRREYEWGKWGCFQSEEVKVLVTQSCPTPWDPINCNPPGYSIHGILQTRILDWVAISFSRGSSRSRDRTGASCIAGRCFTIWVTREANQGNSMCKMHRGSGELGILKHLYQWNLSQGRTVRRGGRELACCAVRSHWRG